MRQPLHRRTLLRGLGVGIALPLLDAMLPGSFVGQAAAAARGASHGKKPINRMVLLYTPNGVHKPFWYPQNDGDDYLATQTLSPLQRHRKDLILMNGLNVDKAKLDSAGDHAKAMGCYLTGVQINKTAGNDIRAGISCDQVMAKAIGNKTRFPSLELGLDYGRMEGGCDPGYACIYSNNVSWTSETTPAIKEVNPRVVFDRLFAGAAADEVRRLVLHP